MRRDVVETWIVFLVAAIVIVAWNQQAHVPFTGDEPHYVATADALGRFHTVDLRPAYAANDGVRKYFPDLPPDHGVDLGDGRLVPYQGIGFPALIVPAWTPTRSLTAVHLELMLLAALALAQIWALLRDLFRDRFAERVVMGLGALTAMPVLVFSRSVYPEMPAALAVALGLRALVRRQRIGARYAMAAVAVALAWLYTRFIVFAVAFAVLVTVDTVREHRASRERRERGTGRVRIGPVLVVAVGALTLAAANLAIYGSLTPVPAIRALRLVPPQTFEQHFRMTVGPMLGRSDGLLPYAPVLLLGLFGALAAARRFGATGALLLGTCLVYLVVVVPYGFMAFQAPGRFAIVLLPFLCIAGVVTLSTARALIGVGVALLIIGVSITLRTTGAGGRIFYRPTDFLPGAAYNHLFALVQPSLLDPLHTQTIARRSYALAAVWLVVIVIGNVLVDRRTRGKAPSSTASYAPA